MSNLSLANQIVAGQPMDPRPIQANFSDIVQFVNDDVFTVDGSKALTGPLTLPGPATAAGHAVQKAQLDSVATVAADATAAASTVAADATAAALVTAASDATTKANAAQAAAIASAQSYTNSKAPLTVFKKSTGNGTTYNTTRNVSGAIMSVTNFNNTGPGNFIVTACLDMQEWTTTKGGSDTFVGELFADGILQDGQMLMYVGQNVRLTLTQTWLVPWTNTAPHDFSIKIRQTGGGTVVNGQYGVNTANHSSLQVLYIGL